jgi:hypothetical protein
VISKKSKISRGFRRLGLAGAVLALVVFIVALVTGTIADKRAGNAYESNYELIDDIGRRYQVRGPSNATEVEVLKRLRESVKDKKDAALVEPIRLFHGLDADQEREAALDHFGLAGISAVFALFWWFLTQSVGWVFSSFVSE